MDAGAQITPSDIEAALGEGRLRVHYMPTVEIKSGICVGAEALLRWPTPEGGFIPPDSFIPLAEKFGLAGAVTAYVIRAVARDVGQLLRERPDLQISINIPPETVGSGIGRRVAEETGLIEVANQIIAEITERQALTKEGRKAMNENRKMGLRVAVDDFGTGYSSLSYLKSFPLDELKIDRSFLNDIPNNTDDAAIVGAIIAMAHGLGMGVVAEGIERQEQLDFLRDSDCDEYQGYLLSKPVLASDFLALVAKNMKKLAG